MKLHQPMTKVLEGWRKIEMLESREESSLVGSKSLVNRLIEPRLIWQLLKPLPQSHPSTLSFLGSPNLIMCSQDQHDVEERLHIMPIQVESIGPVEQPVGHKWRSSSPLLRRFHVIVG